MVEHLVGHTQVTVADSGLTTSLPTPTPFNMACVESVPVKHKHLQFSLEIIDGHRLWLAYRWLCYKMLEPYPRFDSEYNPHWHCPDTLAAGIHFWICDTTGNYRRWTASHRPTLSSMGHERHILDLQLTQYDNLKIQYASAPFTDALATAKLPAGVT